MGIANKIYMTRVHTKLDGDTSFPEMKQNEWEKVFNLDFSANEKQAYAYSFET